MTNQVFVVDDDEFCRLLAFMILEDSGLGLRVNEFSEGHLALAELERLRQLGTWPEAILLDLEMPGMDGRQFMQAFLPWREQYGLPIRVFVLSAARLQDFEPEMLALGADDCYTKPLLPKEFSQIWEKVRLKQPLTVSTEALSA